MHFFLQIGILNEETKTVRSHFLSSLLRKRINLRIFRNQMDSFKQIGRTTQKAFLAHALQLCFTSSYEQMHSLWVQTEQTLVCSFIFIQINLLILLIYMTFV